MKKTMIGLLMVFFAPFSLAGMTLSPLKLIDNKDFVIEQIERHDLERVDINHNQTFHLYSKNKEIGTLIQGKAWRKTTQPVCFIAWSKNGKVIDQFMETIGQGEWEAVGCHEVQSVGIISQQNENDVKIATIYRTELPVHDGDGVRNENDYGTDYYVVGVNSSARNITFDTALTEKFQNTEIKTIAEMRALLSN